MPESAFVPKSFCHQALLHASDEGFLAGTVPFIRDGLAADEPVAVAVGPEKADALRARLGDDAARVLLLDMRRLGRNPARIIPVWRDFVTRIEDGRPARGVGQPVWPGRSEAELTECRHHESLLNRAFDGGPAWWLLCPYDTEDLGPSEIEAARRSHPVIADGQGGRPSDGYREALASASLQDPLPSPPARAGERSFSIDDLKVVRDLVAERALAAGLDPRRVPDLVLAVNELATNSVRHAGGQGTLLVWETEHELVCEVRDGGRIDEPLVGRRRPDPTEAAGRGLWLVNQVCDLVQLRSFTSGNVVRLNMRLGEATAS